MTSAYPLPVVDHSSFASSSYSYSAYVPSFSLTRRRYIFGPRLARIFDCFVYYATEPDGITDEFWFKGDDIATFLGYKKPFKAFRDHLTNDESQSWGSLRDAAANSPIALYSVEGPVNWSSDTTFVNESGLYALSLRSKNVAEARQFLRWVRKGVLPFIRRRNYCEYYYRMYNNECSDRDRNNNHRRHRRNSRSEDVDERITTTNSTMSSRKSSFRQRRRSTTTTTTVGEHGYLYVATTSLYKNISSFFEENVETRSAGEGIRSGGGLYTWGYTTDLALRLTALNVARINEDEFYYVAAWSSNDCRADDFAVTSDSDFASRYLEKKFYFFDDEEEAMSVVSNALKRARCRCESIEPTMMVASALEKKISTIAPKTIETDMTTTKMNEKKRTRRKTFRIETDEGIVVTPKEEHVYAIPNSSFSSSPPPLWSLSSASSSPPPSPLPPLSSQPLSSSLQLLQPSDSSLGKKFDEK